MLTITTPGGPVAFFDSIHELPAKRYAAFQRVWCDHTGVGADMRALDGHRANLALFLGGDDMEAARLAFNNYLLGIRQLEQEGHLGAECLATVLSSINEVPVAAPTDRNYKPLAEQLLETGITQEQVEEALAEVRGKLKRP